MVFDSRQLNNKIDMTLLKRAVDEKLIDLEALEQTIEMNERKKYLAMHNRKIFLGSDGFWHTEFDDKSKKSGRKSCKAKERKALEAKIVKFYKDRIHEPTFDDVFEAWINKKIRNCEILKQTEDRYRGTYEKYIKSTFQFRKIKDIEEDFLDEFVITTIKKNNLKAKGWANIKTVLIGVFLYSKKRHYTNIDITSFLKELQLSRKIFNHDKKPDENTIFTEMEIEKIVGVIETSENLSDIACLIALQTGLRVGEIVALKWEDIIDNKWIRIRRMQEYFKNEEGKTVQRIRDMPKTEAGLRDVPLPVGLAKRLQEHRRKNQNTEYILERSGQPIKAHTVDSKLYNLCDRLQIPRKSMHSFRRYYATKLLDANVKKSSIMKVMGHTDIKTTMQYYYRNNNEKDATYDAINKLFD